MITCVCNNDIMIFGTKKEAVTFWRNGVAACEGSEKERYMNILMDLSTSRSSFVSDGCCTLSKDEFKRKQAEALKRFKVNPEGHGLR